MEGKVARSTIKIAYILPTLRLGGAEKQAVTTATHLDKNRFEPIIIALSSGGRLQNMIYSTGVPCYIMGYKTHNNYNGWLSIAWKAKHIYYMCKLGNFLEQQKPDIIHAYLPSPNVYGALARRLFARESKLIVSKRALGYYKRGRSLLSLMEKWANRVADIVLVNSQAVKRDVLRREKADPGKVQLIYNGIDVNEFAITIDSEGKRRELGLAPDTRIVGVVANLIPYKGHADLIRAARLVLNEVPQVKFLLAGRDDGIIPQLVNLAEELDIADAIIFLGQRQDIPELLSVFDVQVLASHEEGFANVILEGMAAGKPLVVTSVGGNPEAVIHEETGLVVPPKDEKTLAQAIIRLLKNPEEARRFGQAAQQRVKEYFSIEQMVQEMEALYEELV